METGETDVRKAVEADLGVVADTLADAFADYAWTRWALPPDGHRRRLRAAQHHFAARVGLPLGTLHVAGGGAAAALWVPAGSAVPPEVFADPGLLGLYGDRLAAVAEAEEALAAHRPDGPHWTLATVGVRPGAQGRGLGARVLAPGLRSARESGVPAYLETSAERNVRFYERLGFGVTAELEPPGGAPRTWCMLRD
ncbi:GNAT family N-acetyltransferase [Actinorugispora endophytica]|uniref:Acetyltransferase (GNAT) family protein n=1 Tax=Actinorugispora endophytica TaxID=1605990 RepID=A0A4R6V199_9ACTN|nr:GNAT family N-acetyltransferase [Actinorugispora endophytica]TDQ52298.1 acetyltransferase (GNAT) family protein [Actinorugispora endophytica]